MLITTACLLGSVLLASPAVRADAQDEYLREAMRGLEHSMEALRALGDLERVEMLEQLARGLHERLERRWPRGGSERDLTIRQIELMRMALPALLEAERRDSAELVERAIRAREIRLEGRRDDEAREILEQAPERGAEIELMRFAADLWREFGDREKAVALDELAEELTGQLERRRRARAERDPGEREVARWQLEQLEHALAALREAGREEAADAMRRAIRFRQALLDGRRIDDTGPGREQLAELLNFAAVLLEEWEAMERAMAVRELADRILRRGREGREERAESRIDRDRAREWLRRMEVAVHALLEEGREDAADLLRRAQRALEVRLEGRTDREARTIRDRAPGLADQVELLRLAARIWREYGREEKAAAVAELAEELWAGRGRHEREREGRRPDPAEAMMHRLERLEVRLAEIEERLQEMAQALRERGR